MQLKQLRGKIDIKTIWLKLDGHDKVYIELFIFENDLFRLNQFEVNDDSGNSELPIFTTIKSLFERLLRSEPN